MLSAIGARTAVPIGRGVAGAVPFTSVREAGVAAAMAATLVHRPRVGPAGEARRDVGQDVELWSFQGTEPTGGASLAAHPFATGSADPDSLSSGFATAEFAPTELPAPGFPLPGFPASDVPASDVPAPDFATPGLAVRGLWPAELDEYQLPKAIGDDVLVRLERVEGVVADLQDDEDQAEELFARFTEPGMLGRLVERVYPVLRQRLRAELLIDRERRGVLADLR
jgi:hypothetical protein